MRLALVLLVLLSATAANADRERPQVTEQERPRPCKCIRREPQLVYVPDPSHDGFAARVVARAHAYNSGVARCLQQTGAASAELSFSFAKRATEPRVTATRAPALSACLAHLTWHSFDEAPRATTVRVHVSNRFWRS